MSGVCYFCLCVTAVLALNATERSSAGNLSKKLHHRVRDVNRKLHPAEGETPHLPAQGESSWYTCGDGYCNCKGAEAECSGNLHHVPRLPPGVTILYVLKMRIPTISDDFFTNVTGLTKLYLNQNGIHSISSGAFRRLQNLTYIILSENRLTADAASVVFNIPTLEKLVISRSLECDVDDIRIKHPMPRLQKLHFSFNRIVTLNLKWFLFFSGLTSMSINSDVFLSEHLVPTKLLNGQSLHNLSYLTHLQITISTLSCDDLRSVLTIPSLETLSLIHIEGCSACCDIDIQTTVPRLQKLELSNSAFEDLNLTCLSPFKGLRDLTLDKIDKFTKEYVFEKRVMTDYGALHLLPNLTYLDLRYNAVSCKDLLSILTIPSLQKLNMRQGTDCEKYNASISLSLIYVDFTYNNLKYVNFILPFEAGRSSSLQVLILRGNQLGSFTPQTCQNTNLSISMFPSLHKLDISDNLLTDFNVKMGIPVCLPSVKLINLDHNNLYFEFSSFNDDSLGRLETLIISSQRSQAAFKPIRKDVFRNQHLKTLSLQNNVFSFSNTFFIDADCFSVCPNLMQLSLDHTDFTGVSEERFHQLFGRMVNLTVLLLRSTGISFLTVGMFRGLNSLEELDLSTNSLVYLPDNVFQLLLNLKRIDIRANKISVVKESTFSLTTRLMLKRLALSGNPFDCSCQVLWFQKWLLTNPSLFVVSRYAYTCGNLPDTTVQSFFMQEQACLLSPETSKFIIATISLIFITMSLLSFLYRYRWHIRLVLYEAFRAPGDRLRRLRENHFEYDVFVSYDSEDFLWVRDHLMPCLEGRMGLKLCIHQRDFIIGCPVVENIMGCVNSSKKMLMLFSKAFVESQWCQFELQLCLTHAMNTEDALIVVILGDIPPRVLTPSMMAVMKTTTYVEWADDADAVDSFWRRIRLALNEVLQND